jgi:hypothetical protein
MDFKPFGINKMKRLSLEELKAQKVLVNLEAIKGGDANECHVGYTCGPLPVGPGEPKSKTKF